MKNKILAALLCILLTISTGVIANADTTDADNILAGDINLDHTISINDVTAIQKYLAGYITLDKVQKANSDVNNDGIIDINDALQILRYTVHSIEKLETKTFEVTFRDYNDKVISTETVSAGKNAKTPTNPERDNYLFTGWDKDTKCILENMDISAQYISCDEYIDSIKEIKSISLGDNFTARSLYIDGNYLYHTGHSSCGVTRYDINNYNDEDDSAVKNKYKKLITRGHSSAYPRNMAVGNGCLYVPYRDSAKATGTSFITNTGGYLDIIRLSDASKVNTLEFKKDTFGTKNYGKSHFVCTIDDEYLCVTKQMGGWELFDISKTPENPESIYVYDNRLLVESENENKTGFAEYQGASFFKDNKGDIYLAISGYDRDVATIYQITKNNTILNVPKEVFGYHSGSNQLNIRTLASKADLKTPYLHTMGIKCLYPYIYLTVAPYPNFLNDKANTFCGIIILDVTDINNVKSNVVKMPAEYTATTSTGEPSPGYIAICNDKLITDNSEKGISIWSISNPLEPRFIGNINCDDNAICSVESFGDKVVVGSKNGGSVRIFTGF